MVSVVADPVTVRKCGSRKDEPDEEGKDCTEKLQGNDKILVCNTEVYRETHLLGNNLPLT